MNITIVCKACVCRGKLYEELEMSKTIQRRKDSSCMWIWRIIVDTEKLWRKKRHLKNIIQTALKCTLLIKAGGHLIVYLCEERKQQVKQVYHSLLYFRRANSVSDTLWLSPLRSITDLFHSRPFQPVTAGKDQVQLIILMVALFLFLS